MGEKSGGAQLFSFRAHQNSTSPKWEENGEIKQSSGRPRHLSTILLKNLYLFKIAESVIKFCLKKLKINLVILNKCESFSRIVDHVTCLP